MTPLDVKSRGEWETILDRFSSDSNMTSCLTDEAGKQIMCRFDRYPLCAGIRENEKSLTFICSQTNTAMLAVVSKTRQPEIDFCEAGMIRVVVPIIRNGDMIGMVTACGLASRDEAINTFLISRELGVSEEQVINMAKTTPFGSEKDVKEAAHALFRQLNPSPFDNAGENEANKDRKVA